VISFPKWSSKILVLLSGVSGVILGITSVLLFQYAVKAQPSEQKQARIQDQVEPKGTLEDTFLNDDDPFSVMEQMRERMFKGFGQFDALEDDFFDRGFSRFGRSQSYSLNQKENDENLIYEINLKDGVDGNTVDIKVEDGLVTISGQTKNQSDTQNDVHNSFFSSSSSFSQSFSLPEYVDAEKVQIENSKNKITLIFPKIS